MSDTKAIIEVDENKGLGKVTFANEVIAIIAALAASEVKGIAGMSGNVVQGFSEMLGRKNLTKGVKAEVGTEEAAIDVYVTMKYGVKIQAVANEIQLSIKNAIENMTGLTVKEVNVYVQGIEIEKEKEETKSAEEQNEYEISEPQQPRVK